MYIYITINSTFCSSNEIDADFRGTANLIVIPVAFLSSGKQPRTFNINCN